MKKYIYLGATVFATLIFTGAFARPIEKTSGVPAINIVPNNISSTNFQKYSAKRKQLQAESDKLVADIQAVEEKRKTLEKGTAENKKCAELLIDYNAKLNELAKQINDFNSTIEEVVYKDASIDQLSLITYYSLSKDPQAWADFQKNVTLARQKLKQDKVVIQEELAKITPSAQPLVPIELPEAVILSSEAEFEVEDNTLTIDNTDEYGSVEFTQTTENKSTVIASFVVPNVTSDGVFLNAEESKFVSLSTPESKLQVEKLRGKKFDRLVAHGDGATIAEMLIKNSIIKVKELAIMEGDRVLLNGADLQKLIDSKMVERVVVWNNLDDTNVWLVSSDKVAVPQTEKFISYKRKFANMANTASTRKVEYKWIVGKESFAKISENDPQFAEAYFKEIASEFKSKQ
ncbi:MAG: hypothetical protein WBM13_04445 [Bacteroidia bacterium]